MASITAATLYAVAKDFQLLIAALVALAAALAVRRGGQAAARRQSANASDVRQRRLHERQAEDERSHHRRELATTIRVAVKFQLMRNLLSERLEWIRLIEDRCANLPGAASVYLVPDDFDVWRWFREARPVVREAEPYDSRQEEIEYLDPRYQVLYHSLHRLVLDYDKLHAGAVAQAESSAPKSVYLEHIKDAAAEAIDFMAANHPRVVSRIEYLGSRFDSNAEFGDALVI